MSRRVLVTGAFGFLGRKVVSHWADQGWQVIGLGHGDWEQREWREWGLEDWRSAEVNLETLAACAGRPDLIVHCAGSGSVNFSVENPHQDFERTTLTTAAVLEYVRTHSPETRVVFPSSAAVYGAVSSLPIIEAAKLDPVSPYGVHKHLAEELCASYAKTFGLRVAVVRFFSIYGNGLRKQLLWDACCKFSSGKAQFAGTGNELRDWIHVSDAVELLACAAEQAGPDCTVVNGGSGSSTSVREIVSKLIKFFPGAECHFTGNLRHGDPDHFQADISRALSIGWKPRVALDEGIKRYVEWFKAGAK